MVERLKAAKKRTVGTKQTSKAVEKGEARIVFIALDSERNVIETLEKLCEEQSVEIVYVESMKQLGELCGIEVGAASAAIL
jgi:large subunit ribosomal protein L7A